MSSILIDNHWHLCMKNKSCFQPFVKHVFCPWSEKSKHCSFVSKVQYWKGPHQTFQGLRYKGIKEHKGISSNVLLGLWNIVKEDVRNAFGLFDSLAPELLLGFLHVRINHGAQNQPAHFRSLFFISQQDRQFYTCAFQVVELIKVQKSTCCFCLCLYRAWLFGCLLDVKTQKFWSQATAAKKVYRRQRRWKTPAEKPVRHDSWDHWEVPELQGVCRPHPRNPMWMQ